MDIEQAKYVERIEQLEKENDALKEKLEKFDLLNDKFSEMLTLPDVKSIYKFIAVELQRLYPHCIVLYISINEQQKETCLECVEGIENILLKKILSIAGFNPIGKKFKLLPKHNAHFRTGKLIHIEGSLSEFSSTEFPAFLAHAIEKLINLHKIYTIGIVKDDELLAAIHFFTFNNTEIIDNTFIETFVKMSGTVLQKKISELSQTKSEARLKAVIQSLPDMLFIQDINGVYVDYFIPENTPTYAQNVFVGQNMQHVLPVKLVHELLAIFKNVVKTQQTQYLEYSLPFPDKTRFFDARFFNYETDKILSIVRDITDRKEAEQALNESEERFKNIVNFSPNAMYFYRLEHDARLILIGTNPSADKIIGIAHDRLIGKTIEEAFPNLANTGIPELYKKIAKEEIDSHTFDISYQDERFSGFYKVHVFKTQTNTIAVEFTDISDIRKAELLLKVSEEKYKNEHEKLSATLNALPDLLFEIDDESRIYDYRAPNADLLYLPPSDFLGKKVLDIMPNEVSEKIMYAIEKANDLGKVSNIEYSLQLPHGIQWFDASIAVKNTSSGNHRYIILIRNITERKILEQSLRKLNSDKDRFLKILAHDLKNPFHSIMGFSELLIKNIHKYDKEKVESQLKLIHQTTHKTYDLLEDLLLWSKSQSNKAQCAPQPLVLNNICSEQVERITPLAEAKRIKITYFETDNITVLADENMLKTVLRNLISNSIKFTNKNGKINIHTEINHNEVITTISDNGIGIKEENIPKLWEMNEQFTTYGTDGEKGTGFGLTLCKEFVEKQGGNIWVESESGKGSDFKFTLPLCND